MEQVLVYCSATSPRLTYVLDWLLKERLKVSYTITHNESDVLKAPFALAYGKALPQAISIPDAGLLSQTGIAGGDPETGAWQNIPTLFATAKKTYSIPFDIFSAIFWLISRTEEYLPYKHDKHGRYPAKSSILYRKGWLQRPLVDEWIAELRKALVRAGADIRLMPFVFQPTYDIDIAYSHLYKGVRRMAGALMRAMVKMDFRQLSERIAVIKRRQKDPYDSFRWLRQLHKEYGYKPIYFILAATRTTPFDKNISPNHPAMVRVIRNLARESNIGIHPSYYSDRDAILQGEKQLLENIASRDIHSSRQHYIRMVMPGTCRQLLQQGITDDYSMGYGSHLGFRAGTGASFPWYDLQNERVTTLRIHPFCFMDTTALYEQKLNAHDAFNKLHAMSHILEQSGSTLVTVFHNFSLGTAHEWKGWKHAYESFLQENAAKANNM